MQHWYEIVEIDSSEVKIRVTQKIYVTKARRADYVPTVTDPNSVAWNINDPHPGYEEKENVSTRIYKGKELC